MDIRVITEGYFERVIQIYNFAKYDSVTKYFGWCTSFGFGDIKHFGNKGHEVLKLYFFMFPTKYNPFCTHMDW